MDKPTRRSRYRFDGADADDRPLQITARDIAILELLDPEYRYCYLPSHWVRAFVGGDLLRVSKRLGRLSRAPHRFLLRPPQRTQSLNANYKHDVYARAEAGDRFLIKRAKLQSRARRPSEPYAHQLLNDLVDGSIEIGVLGNPALRLIAWKQILANPNLPASTRRLAHPFHIPISGDTLIPDGRPFVIERTLPDASKRYLCIAGKEIDRHTEPLVPSNLERSSIARKLELYRSFVTNRIYHSHFGFPNAVVLIITTNERHLANMMALTHERIGACPYLLFKHVPDWAYAPHFPAPNGDMLGPYERVGHPPISLATF